MGTIRSGFWTIRFLISPDAFKSWYALCLAEGFSFPVDAHQRDVVDQYTAFYEALMNTETDIPLVPHLVSPLVKPDFQSGLHLASGEWSFYPAGQDLVRKRMFVQLSSPKHYAVDSEDGVHFTYEDIHEKEPHAKLTFDTLTGNLKKLTKPLYYRERPLYAVRIDKAAYADLQQSAFLRESGEGLHSKW